MAAALDHPQPDMAEARDYFRKIGAPAIFDHLARELLQSQPAPHMVMPCLQNALQGYQPEGVDARPPAEREALRERQKAAFDTIDKICQHDGSVSKEELFQVMQKERLAARVLFRELDVDSDGSVTLAEWFAWFDRLGSEEDVENQLEWIEGTLAGRLEEVQGTSTAAVESAGEWAAVPVGRAADIRDSRKQLRQRAQQAFAEIDKVLAKDGQVTKPELLRVLRQERLAAKLLFSELDQNADGSLSLKEWLDWVDRVCRSEGEERMSDRLDLIEERLAQVGCSVADGAEGADSDYVEGLQRRGRELNRELERIADRLVPRQSDRKSSSAPGGRREKKASVVGFT
eukprot:TRINITY_DN70759_c0_g1_i1.p1 TRINITY_DN70759_c0_g1~~TRINITY_DN70759_c0_g1_i1.p1  ORF type:complete len:384 (+),score=115.78 TRINITY_DN70759_c0_g1_i1:123-1154(+)